MTPGRARRSRSAAFGPALAGGLSVPGFTTSPVARVTRAPGAEEPAAPVVVLTAPAPKKEEPRIYFAPMGLGAQLGGRF